MIDFRYHLVSLAAVLIALSIGIVLGAGPLNDNIGSTLSGEVTKLRREKDALRARGNDQRRQIEGRDAYDEATLDTVVQGRLTDRQVTVVSLPQAADEDVAAIRDTLEQAGASVGDTVEVTSARASTDDQLTSTRSTAGQAALHLPRVGPAVPDGAQRVDRALAVILTGRTKAGSPDKAPMSDREAAWTELRDAGLVKGSDTPPAAAELVVLVGGPVPATTADSTDAVDREAERIAGSRVALTHLVQTHADGAVLAAAEADTGTSDASPLTMARTPGSLADGVSTVDVPSIPMGRAAIVLALVEQSDGGSGDYGLGQSADGPVPTLK
ncbi:copper transporter [Janibacter limosus]|uniref:copper transporter n=1 Tax=Janibacter limosus TaxID=53458 RepID=UPI0035DF11D0|nr:copper transporter [Janibacter limosus]